MKNEPNSHRTAVVLFAVAVMIAILGDPDDAWAGRYKNSFKQRKPARYDGPRQAAPANWIARQAVR